MTISTIVTRPIAFATALLLGAAGGCTQNPPVPEPVATTPVVTVPEALNTLPKNFAEYTQLVWSDEFDGNTLNPAKWRPEVKSTWYNDEKQATTSAPANLSVTGGNLLIRALKVPYIGPDQVARDYTSARINTKGLKDFNFGRIDVRAKLPKGKGLWPAIWMLGSNDSQVSWPACGEIDIMELKGSEPQINIGTLHFGTDVASKPPAQSGTYALPSDDFSTDFHVFSLVRGQDKLQWFVDGNLFFTRTRADVSIYPFNNPFYLILNVAVGGIFDGDPDASTTFPQQMLVDYVRYYKYQE